MLCCYGIASQFLGTRFNYYSSQADTGGTPPHLMHAERLVRAIAVLKRRIVLDVALGY
jgi:hypothetical protein